MNFQSPGQSATLSMNRPLTPSLSPSDGERVAEGRVRGGSWSQCMRKSERGLSMNLTSVGTSRCDVLARESAGGIVAPLNAARTAQRAAPTRFRGSMREVLFRGGLSMNLVAADVSRRTDLLSRQRISADSRRPLRFRSSSRESFRGNLSLSHGDKDEGRWPTAGSGVFVKFTGE